MWSRSEHGTFESRFLNLLCRAARGADNALSSSPTVRYRKMIFSQETRDQGRRHAVVTIEETEMRFDNFSFGSLRIDGSTYEHDVVIDRGKIRKRQKKPSKKFREDFGHTPLSAEEEIPWKCLRLVVGTGAHGRLPVMKEVQREAERHRVKLLILPTIQAIEVLQRAP